MPSYAKGEMLLKKMALEGYYLFNVRIITPLDLARNKIEDYLKDHDLQLIASSESRQVVFNIMEDLINNNKLSYFSHLKPSNGIIKAIHNAIHELKMAGVNSKPSEKSPFVNPQKEKDLMTIYKHYQNYLQGMNWLDEGDLFNKAITLKEGEITSGESVKYLVSDAYLHDLTYLERQLVDSLPDDSLHIIDELTDALNDAHEGDDQIDTWKRKITFNTKEQIDLFSASGESVEVKQVFSWIRDGCLPFDRTIILYSSSSPYSELIYKLSEKYQIPVTFGEGIMIQNTKPGKLLFLLLEWINSGYRVTDLNKILDENLLYIGEGTLSGYKIRKLLREASIGWSRNRYFHRLEKVISELENLEELDDNAIDDNDHSRHQRLLGEYRALYRIINDIFTCLDYQTDEQDPEIISLASLSGCIARFIDEFGQVTSQFDKEAQQRIRDELELISQISKSYLEIDQAIERLKESIENIRVGQELPQAGHIHVDHYQNGWWMLRDNVYLIGFDADRFPGNRQEDPILLDEERKQISDWLPLGQDRPKENYQLVLDMLKGIADMTGHMENGHTENRHRENGHRENVHNVHKEKGQMVISYSSFDTTEHKEKFPSSLLLQVYRQISGDSDADYTTLQNYLMPPEGMIPKRQSEVMDEIDWWLANYVEYVENGQHLQLNHIVYCYPDLQKGVEAFQNRLSPEFTVYDGNVSADRTAIDPRERAKPISPTRLELLGRCPYGYFLNQVLGIEPPEDIEFDPGKWLDSLTRGSLLHTIFEQFYRELTLNQEKPQEHKHSEYLTEMAEELIDQQLEELPPPSDLVYQYEKDDLLNSALVFLRSEQEYFESSRPIYFELYFGRSGDEQEHQDMVPVELPSGKRLYLSGKIDRVDLDQDGNYLAYDYKTGSTYGYSESEYYKGGRQLQHALYALALEQILQENYPHNNIKVTGAGYLFPTVKGEGVRYIRYYEDNDREQILELVDKLLDLLSQGKFVMTDDTSDCNICDYQVICDRKSLDDSITEMFDYCPELDLFRQVRKFE